MNSRRIQSALEYLSSYIWLFLGLAVVLVVFFALGFFNLQYLYPKAGPGSCYVYRPSGSFSVTGISLVGVCGQLPEYVGEFTQSLKSNFSLTIPSARTTQITISWWENPNNIGVYSQNIGEVNGTNNGGWYAITYITPPPNANWIHDLIIINLNTKMIYFYINDTVLQQQSWSVGSTFPNNVSFDMGGAVTLGGTTYHTFDGQVSNLQIYNGSLNTNDLLKLYVEGPGGPPINLQQLVGWFQLDGNTKDSSGNGLHATTSNIAFSSSYNYVPQVSP